MAKQVKRRRGTTAEHSAFTGAPGEITVDITANTVVVHDGILAGGYPLGKADASNINLSNQINVNELATSDGNAGDVLTTDGTGNVSFTAPGGISPNSVGVTELNLSDGLAGTFLRTDGAGTITFGAPSIGIDELECVDGTDGQVITTDGSGTIAFETVSRLETNSVGIAELDVSDGSSGQVLSTNGAGGLSFVNQTGGGGGGGGSSTFVQNTFTGNGSTTTFTLSTAAPYEESLLVYLDGVSQPTTAYTLPTTTSITFSSAPPNNCAIKVLHLGIASNVASNSIGVTELNLSDGSADMVLTTNGAGTISFSHVTSAMIGSGTIIAQDIATNAVNGTHIAMGSDAAGDMLYYNGTDYVRLGVGSAGQTLTVNSGGTAPEWAAGGGGGSFSTGMIMMWSGSVASIPSGWVLCDGNNSTPDLRDKFVIGAGSTYNPSDTGGSTSTGAHTLTVAEMPSHNHTFSYNSPNQSTPAPSFNHANNVGSAGTVNTTTGNTGGDGSHSHTGTLPPYYSLAFIMKT